MARIRSTKPEFWSDEKLAPLPAIDRLVFLGIIAMADDVGRLVDNVKQIDAFIFPETDESAKGSIAQLAAIARIRRGKTDNGQAVIQIVNWHKHQRIEKPHYLSCLPPIAGEAEDRSASAQKAKRFGRQEEIDLGDRNRSASGNDPGHPTGTVGDATLDHDRLSTTNDQRPTTTLLTPDTVVAEWNRMAATHGYPRIQARGPGRVRALRSRTKEPEFVAAFSDALAFLGISEWHLANPISLDTFLRPGKAVEYAERFAVESKRGSKAKSRGGARSQVDGDMERTMSSGKHGSRTVNHDDSWAAEGRHNG